MMSTVATKLKKYLDEIGFNGIYKYLSGINFYSLSPYRVNEASELTPDHINTIISSFGTSCNLIKCLTLSIETPIKNLEANEQNLAELLVEEGYLNKSGSNITNCGFQLISYHGCYLMIDGRMNYGRKGNHEVYIGIDTYLMLYYLEHEKINKDSKCLDLCTGSGIGALTLSNGSENVVATDIAELPLRLSQFNCFLNGKESNITIRNQDFSETISKNESFDVITCNPPFVAFPPELKAPIFAKGYDLDGLGHFRLLFSRMSSLLTENGTAFFVSDFIGDEKLPYFADELKELAEKYKLEVDLFIDNKLPAEDQLAFYPQYLQKFNKELTLEEIKEKSYDFILNQMKAKYYYLSTLRIKKNKVNPTLRIFNRYTEVNSIPKNKEFSFHETFTLVEEYQ